ncbi:enoyl-CoA hydratase-related protein [Streptosporangium sp. NPDC002544]|uniref:enoyl-CoA hydratase/isomerase family protein n=1 Tax=Streptosporangium sp. NPDC002544 TaxID=3154538 RepID=UPI0033248327
MPDLIIEKNPDKHYMLFRFNRPEQLNAITPAMQSDLKEGVAELAADPEMRVGILTGTGRAFSAGADLKAMAERNAESASLDAKAASGEITAEERRDRARVLGAGSAYGVDAIPKFPFAACPKPVIAAVNGLCVAGGMEMAIDCDIRIASTEAYFGVFEAKRGIMAGIAVQHLARVMPVGEAMNLLLTCDRMSAERAHQLGFVQQVVEPGALLDRAVQMAEMIGANAPLPVQGSKAMVQFWRHYGVEEARRLEEYVWKRVFESDDAKEGPRAFAEKRAPSWTGR